MKDGVTVNGVYLTRSDIEAAVKRLNEPLLACLTRLKNKDSRKTGVVITGYVQKTYRKGYHESLDPFNAGDYTVVDQDGQGYTYNSENALLKFWDIEHS